MMDLGSMMGGVGKTITSLLGGLGEALPYVFALVIMAGIFFWIWWEMQFNKRVLIYKLVGSSFRLIDDKARVILDKNRVSFWRLKKIRKTIDVPPSECLVYSQKGEVAECYMNSVGEIIWIKHGYTPDIILKKVKQYEEAKSRGETPADLDAHDKAVVEFVKSYRPVTTTQRASYAYQDDQARSYKKEDWLKQNMPLIISGVFIILTLAIFMMFFGKVVEPTLSAQDRAIQYEKIRLEELEIIQTLSSDVQMIKNEMNITNEAIPSR